MYRERKVLRGAISGGTDSHQLKHYRESFDKRAPRVGVKSQMIFVAGRRTRLILASASAPLAPRQLRGSEVKASLIFGLFR